MSATLAIKADSMLARAVALVTATFLIMLAVGQGATAARPLPAKAPPWPTTKTVLREFDPPWPDWLPGHRGLDLSAVNGSVVRTPRAGVVAWRGQAGGTPIVVIRHGVARATYQPVLDSLPVGTRVASGDVIGSMTTGTHCSKDCLHWGLKVAGRYLDPRSLLQELHPVLVTDPPSG